MPVDINFNLCLNSTFPHKIWHESSKIKHVWKSKNNLEITFRPMKNIVINTESFSQWNIIQRLQRRNSSVESRALFKISYRTKGIKYKLPSMTQMYRIFVKENICINTHLHFCWHCKDLEREHWSNIITTEEWNMETESQFLIIFVLFWFNPVSYGFFS